MEFLSVRQCKGYRLPASDFGLRTPDFERDESGGRSRSGRSPHGEQKGVREGETLRRSPSPSIRAASWTNRATNSAAQKGGTVCCSIGILIPIETYIRSCSLIPKDG